MILNNAKPRLIVAFQQATKLNKPIEVTFIYNEMLTQDEIHSVFRWLFKRSIEFQTQFQEYRFAIIVHPASKWCHYPKEIFDINNTEQCPQCNNFHAVSNLHHFCSQECSDEWDKAYEQAEKLGLI